MDTQPNPVEVGEAIQENKPVPSLWSTALLVFLCLAIALSLLFGIPNAEVLFKDFEVDLALLTQLVIKFHAPIATAFILLAILLVAKECLFRQSGLLRKLINIAATGVICLMVCIYVFSILLPIFNAMEHLP